MEKIPIDLSWFYCCSVYFDFFKSPVFEFSKCPNKCLVKNLVTTPKPRDQQDCRRFYRNDRLLYCGTHVNFLFSGALPYLYSHIQLYHL